MKVLVTVLDDFINLFFPALCRSCGESLVRGEEFICTECLVGIKRTGYHLDRGNQLEQIFWGRCAVDRAAAFSVYNRGSCIRKLIHKMKYKDDPEIGFMLGRLYGTYLKGSSFIEGIDLLIPVPLHPAKQRQRGYNQSGYIAQGLSFTTGIPVNDKILIRTSGSSTQTKRHRYERWENVQGLFTVTDSESINGRHVMVVDDVITTGSTMEACVEALTASSDTRVSVVALAVTQRLTV